MASALELPSNVLSIFSSMSTTLISLLGPAFSAALLLTATVSIAVHLTVTVFLALLTAIRLPLGSPKTFARYQSFLTPTLYLQKTKSWKSYATLQSVFRMPRTCPRCEVFDSADKITLRSSIAAHVSDDGAVELEGENTAAAPVNPFDDELHSKTSSVTSFDLLEKNRRGIWVIISRVSEVTTPLRALSQKHEEDLMESVKFS